MASQPHSGMLRQTIEIQRLVKTPDGSGGNTDTWQTTHTCAAHIEPRVGKERVVHDNDIIETTTTHRITMRYISGVSPDDRVRYTHRFAGAETVRVFDIKGVINHNERNQWLRLSTLEIGGDRLMATYKHYSSRQAYVQDLRKGIRTLVHSVAADIQGNAVELITGGAKTGHVYRNRGRKGENRVDHQASAPGQAPAADQNTLHTNIALEVSAGGMEVEVQSRAKYSKALEFGAILKNGGIIEPRPFMQPAVEMARAKYNRGGGITIGRPRRGRRKTRLIRSGGTK